MLRLLTLISRHGVLLMASGIVIGLGFPSLAELVRPLLAPIVITMLASTLARVDLALVKHQVRRPVAVLVMVAWLLLITPLMTIGMLNGLSDFLPTSLSATIVLWAACPPLASAPALAILMRLNGSAIIIVTLLSTFIFPFTLPPIAAWLLQIDLAISPFDLFLRLAATILTAAILALMLRQISRLSSRHFSSLTLDGLLVLCMLLFAVALMDGMRDAIASTPWRVAGFVLAAFTVSLMLQFFGSLSSIWLTRDHAGAVGVASGNRNLALIISAAGGALGPDAFLFLAALQFPIYLSPMILTPLYRNWCRREHVERSDSQS